MYFLKFLKVLAIILGIIALPLVFLGVGIFISIPLFLFAYAMDKITNPKPGQRSWKLFTNLVILFAGVGCFYGLYFIGAVGHMDTTGEPDTGFAVISGVICAGITGAVLWVVNTRKV